MTIRVADISYGEPAWLMDQTPFIVYETESAKEKAEKNMGQSAIWTQYLEREGSVGVVPQKSDDFSEKNVTIATYSSEIIFQGKSP